MNYDDFIFPILVIATPIILGFLSGKLGYAKSKVKQLRIFFTDIDEALYDDTVTETEFRKIFESGRNLLS